MHATRMQVVTVLKAIWPLPGKGCHWVSLRSVAAIVWSATGFVLLFGGVPQWSIAYGQSTSTPNSEAAKPAVAKPSMLTFGPNEIPLLKSLQDRQARLETLAKREQELDIREEGLRVIEKQIEEKLATLHILRKEIAALLEEKDAFEDARYKHLVKVYEGMEASEAGLLVERLQEYTAIQILTRMKSKKVGKILESIDPRKAAKLSEQLAIIPQQKVGKK